MAVHKRHPGRKERGEGKKKEIMLCQTFGWCLAKRVVQSLAAAVCMLSVVLVSSASLTMLLKVLYDSSSATLSYFVNVPLGV